MKHLYAIFLIAALASSFFACANPTGAENPAAADPKTPAAPATPAGATKAITAFGFASPAATGTIDEAYRTIAVTVPYGTAVTALAPTIAHTGASVSPAALSAQDFSSPKIYTVTAEDGSTRSYTVTVTVAPASAKAITGFSFVSPVVTGTIDEAAHTVLLVVPGGTNLGALTPAITHTGSSASPASGTAQDFSSPSSYTVTAADGSTQTYTVTVKKLPWAITDSIVGNLTYTVTIAGISATGGGIVADPGSSAVTEAGLCWGTTANPTADSAHVAASVTTGPFTAQMMGLSPQATIYVRAYAISAVGTGYGEEVSFNSGRLFNNDAGVGGWVFYNDGTGHGMAAATADLGPAVFSTDSQVIPSLFDDIGRGQQNTAAIIAQYGVGAIGTPTLIAADLCDEYIDIFVDWFLPSADELKLMHTNLKTAYKGNFSAARYWTSSQVGASLGRVVDFTSGIASTATKTESILVRAARKF